MFQIMVDVFRYLVSETKYFRVAHYGISFVEFLDVLPLEPFPWTCSTYGYGPYFHTCY